MASFDDDEKALPSFTRGAEFDDDRRYADDYYDYDDDVDYSARDNDYSIPDKVRIFIQLFHKRLKERNVYEIEYLYETNFNKLTDQFYKSSPWPSVDAVSPLVNGDSVFLTLYKEMYYRHIYSKLQPTLEQRIESFDTYQSLFDYILGATNPVPLELPNPWLWDIIDEYIYQFQAFSQYRYKLKSKSSDEIEFLKVNAHVWSVQSVLRTLHGLVAKSNIVALLEREGRDSTPVTHHDKGFEFGAHSIYKMLGYFSIIGLARVHCLLGDYHAALKTLAPIDVNKQSMILRVTPCYVTLHYYLGFAYLMQRRYVDAIRAWSSVLLYISRTKQFHTRSYQYDQVQKKNEQMYSLLAIAVSLCPQRIDENVHQLLREKHSDKMIRMQRGDEAVFEELFFFACPKFISPALPTYEEDAASNPSQDAYRHQLKIFLDEVRQQALLPTIRSYLKLYTTMAVPKLAQFLEISEGQFRTLLLCYKHKTRNATHESGPWLAGTVTSSSDVEFYLDESMVHIADTKVARRYGTYFIRHIKKFDQIIADLESK